VKTIGRKSCGREGEGKAEINESGVVCGRLKRKNLQKPKEGGGRRLSLKKKDGFRVRFFFVFFLLSKMSPSVKTSVAWYF
jgi:hypothetical protein